MPVVAVAGGVTEDNVGAYVDAGCRLVVTSSPFFGKPCDVKVGLQPANGAGRNVTDLVPRKSIPLFRSLR